MAKNCNGKDDGQALTVGEIDEAAFAFVTVVVDDDVKESGKYAYACSGFVGTRALCR